MTIDKARTVTLNPDQRLYVIPESPGYSCLGFDVAETRRAAYAGWLAARGQTIPIGTPEPGTLAHYEAYRDALARVLAYCAAHKARCDVDLTPQLVGLEGKRVEVVNCFGERSRFIVGKSTGPIPIHLEIKRRDSSGGGAVVCTPFQSVKVID